MGRSRNAAELAKKMAKFSAVVAPSVVAGLAKAGGVMELQVAKESGKYAGRPIVRTQARLRRGENPSVTVRMVDRKAHLLDHDTRNHPIIAGAVTGRGKQAKALRTPYGPRVSVKHPGTKGKFMWEKALVTGLPKAYGAVDDALGDGMIKVFGL